ncbi:MAG: hypothetical protein JWP72_1808 [Massilia sp.]|nr:hypothetical protein [Massilia sp.]
MRSWSPLFATAVSVLGLSVIASCYAPFPQPNSPVAHPATPATLTADKMTDYDKLFEQVPFGKNERTVCSPEDPGPGFDWRGVLVRAPSTVDLPDQDAPSSTLIIPLCGIYTINLAKAIRHPGRQVLIVTNDSTGQTYRGEIVDRDPNLLIPPPPTRRLRAEDYEHQAFGGYLNVNVASFVALPSHPARYRVKVKWSGYESNEVSIAVVQRP